MSDPKQPAVIDNLTGITGGSPTILVGRRLAMSSGSKTKGRANKLLKYMEDLCKSHEVPFSNPVEMLLFVATTGIDPLEDKINRKLGDESPFAEHKTTALDGSGKRVRIAGFVPLETRIDCIRLATPFMLPKLSSVELQAEDEKDVGKDVEYAQQMSRDPDIRRLMEKIAMRAELPPE